MKETAEFKIKKLGDTSKWEELPVTVKITIREMQPSRADKLAKEMIAADQTIKEIRWNWQGSYQGHYVANIENVFKEIENRNQVEAAYEERTEIGE